MHALSCAAKSLIGFICRDGIQECREACGGHGYLAGRLTVYALYKASHLPYTGKISVKISSDRCLVVNMDFYMVFFYC